MFWLILALVVCVALACAVLGMVAVPARREGRQVLTPRGENLVSSVAQTTDKVGTKVPVAAVGAQRSARDQQHWQTITPLPIAWGTPDESVVAQARKSIPQEQWNELDRARRKADLVERSKNALVEL